MRPERDAPQPGRNLPSKVLWVVMGRHRTTRMIMALPDAGAMLLAPDHHIALELLRMLLELRGPEFDAKCTVLVVRTKDDLRHFSNKPPRRLAYDHTFSAFADPDLFDFVRGWVSEWNRIMDARAESRPTVGA